MVVISAIDGMAGIGKSALAVHAAHRIGHDFPDGQLFVDLRGNAAGVEPMTAGQALDQLLRSLDVPSPVIPEDLGERAALYRSRLAGTRTLILLDNVASTAQVRPLLPGAPGCMVLITSRTVLAGLDDAHLLNLGVLADQDAATLLRTIAGPARIPADHPAVPELIALCGGLPLAIRIVAARLRHHRALRIEDLVERLRDDASRLNHLKDEDRNLQALFDASYAGLYEQEQRMFRFLGLIPGPDTDAWAASHLLGSDLPTTERLLESLLDRNLLTQQAPGRYRLHDLLREYSRARVAADDTPEARSGATERLLDYYQHVCQAADRHIARLTRPDAAAPTEDTAPRPVPKLPGRPTALAWMRTERANLVAALSGSIDPRRRIALTATMAAFLHIDGPWTDAATLHRSAAAMAAELDQPAMRANALWDLGRIMNVSGQLSAAVEVQEQALDLYRRLGDRRGQANALYELGRIKHVSGETPASAELQEAAAALYRSVGDRRGEAETLTELGRVRQATGQQQASLDLLRQALPLFRHLKDALGEANALIDIAHTLNIDADYAAATEHASRAMRLYQEVESRQGESHAYKLLGQIWMTTGDHAEATDAFVRALEIDREVGFRQGEGICLWGLGHMLLATGDHRGAAERFEESLAIFTEAGYGLAQANALHGLGQSQRANKQYAAAEASLHRALEIFSSYGDQQGRAEVLNALGTLALDTGRPADGLDHHREALLLAREAPSPLDEARALEGTVHCLGALGDRDAALTATDQALALYRRLGSAEAEQAVARLTCQATALPRGSALPGR